MCGIVLAGGNMFSSDVDIFEKLVFHDIERGKDSTGVMTYRGKQTEICKLALPSDLYLHTKEWKEFRSKQVPLSTVATTTTTLYGSVYVGHNRAATLGKVCNENAHPFQSGHITLVHNGTLRNQSLLPDHKDFEVDSANIAHSIEVLGADKTIQLLNGAFTLVWIDSSDETLHIVRNSERPFHLLEATSGDWFGASEEDMLMWVLLRQKSWSKTRIKRHFETKVGVEYIFNISGKQMKLKEEKEHTLPTFRSTTTYSSVDWDDYRYGNYSRSTNQTRTTPVPSATASAVQKGIEAGKEKQDFSRDGVNKLLEKEGLSFRVDNRIGFWPVEYKPYSINRKDYGCVRGLGYNNVDGKSIPYMVVVHNVAKFFWDEIERNMAAQDVVGYATVRSATMLTGVCNLAAHGLTFSTVAPAESEKISKEQKKFTSQSGFLKTDSLHQFYNGMQVGYAVWAELAQKQRYQCPLCGGPVLWSETDDCLINKDGELVHYDCEHWDNVGSAPVVISPQFQSAHMKDGSHITFEAFRTQMQVQGGVCPMCDDPIDWDEIESCVYFRDGRTIMHDGCSDLVNYDPTLEQRIAELDAAIVEEDNPIDQFLCDICRDVCNMSERNVEASEALHTDICTTCATVHKLLHIEDKKAEDTILVKVYRGGTEVFQYETISKDQYKKFFIKAMGSAPVPFEELDNDNVRITKLGTRQWRYYRAAKAAKPDDIEILSLSKTLTNGMRINKAMWHQWNTCSSCRSVIPWKDADKAIFDSKKRIHCERCAVNGKVK